MIERDKQVSDQQKKHANEKERPEHPAKTTQSEQQEAGMATDPETTKDQGYAKRMEEKTNKH